MIDSQSFQARGLVRRHSPCAARSPWIAAVLFMALLMLSGQLLADVNVLIIGSTRDSGERHHSGVWWNAQKPAYTPNSKPFSPTEIGNQLRSILSQDIPSRGAVNVTVLDRYMSHPAAGNWTAYSYNLATWLHYPYPAGSEVDRWANLRGEAGTPWDYVVLIGDPYTMEYTPGVYALGVARIAEEVAKGSAELVLLMPWPGSGSSSSVNHYKEVVYRTARAGGHKVAPGALAWQACGSPSSGTSHPNAAGAYIAAASIYSCIYNQSAKVSGYAYNDTNADKTYTAYTTNNNAQHYTGNFGFQNPYLIVDDKKREVHMSETGTSTEDGFKAKIKSAMNRAKVSYVDSVYNDKYDTETPEDDGLGWPTGNPMPLDFNYGRDGFMSESLKKYMINPAYWRFGFGYYYQHNSWSQPVETANDEHIALMQMQDNDLANRMLREAPYARNIPVRTLWAQISKLYPTLNPLRDGSGPHLSYNVDEAVGSYIYTMYSGRCPLDPKPDTDDIVWNCRRIGYETAWMAGRCQSRAPGFKVTPSAANKTTLTPGTTETMTVEFILPPQDDVTVTVACSSPTAAILGPKTLTFTPSNYATPQQVTIAGIQGTSASEPFEVTFSTSSNDEACNGLSDSWSYTIKRGKPVSVTQIDNGTSNVTAFQNSPLSINLNAAGANSGNTVLVGPYHGSIVWTGDGIIQYTPDNGYLGGDLIVYAATVGTVQTIGCIQITVEVPEGQVNVAAGDVIASEQGSDNGSFVISRLGSTAGSLNVHFSMGGTATLGVDYTLSKTSPVTIPAGQSAVTITLQPIDDTVFGEGQESAMLTITPNAAYPVGKDSAVVIIADNDNRAPMVGAGDDMVVFQTGGVGAAGPVAGADVFLDAGLDGGLDSIWEDRQGKWDLTIDTANVAFLADAGSSLHGITAAYDFAGGITSGGGGCDGISLNDMGAGVDTSPITLEIWFKPDASATYPSNGQILWETGGGSGFGIFYNNGFVEVAHDSNQSMISHDVRALVDEFIQVVVTYDPTSNTDNFKLYINGELKVTASRSDGDMCGGDGAGLGNRGEANTGGRGGGDSNTASFDGKIAIFRSYHHQLLDAAGVAINYDSIVSGDAKVNLNGTAGDPDGDAFTTTWSVIGGNAAAVTFDDVNLLNANVSFSEAGTYVLRLTVDDGIDQSTDDVIVVVKPPLPVAYSSWASGDFAQPFHAIDPAANQDGDGLNNLQEFAFGTDPTRQDARVLVADGSVNGLPVSAKTGAGGFEFLFVRRADHGTSGSVRYIVQFSSDLATFYDSAVTPTFVADSAVDPDYEVVKVAYPGSLPNGQPARFGRLAVVEVP